MSTKWPPGPLRWPADALTDGVVVLDRPRGPDAPLIARACQDPLSARWLPLPSPYTERHAHDFIASRQQAAEDGEALTFAVRDLPRDVIGPRDLIGMVSLQVARCRDGEAEIGYWTAPWARGRGVAARAVRLVARYGFGYLDLPRIEILVAVGNDASWRAARKAGVIEEGIRRAGLEHDGGRRDAWVGVLLPDDAAP